MQKQRIYIIDFSDNNEEETNETHILSEDDYEKINKCFEIIIIILGKELIFFCLLKEFFQ